MTYRIVQWTTGNVGKKSVHAIASNPTLRLVGCYAWSKDKVGRDVGDLCGIEPLGVTATDDVEALLALKPDCVVYNPMFANVDELTRILCAGINVVATAGFITGHFLGEGRHRIAEACERGGSTIFGSGINPGFIQLFAIVSAGLSDRVDSDETFMTFDSLRPHHFHSTSITVSMTAAGPQPFAFSPVYGTGTHVLDAARILGDPAAAFDRSVMMTAERKIYLAQRWKHWRQVAIELEDGRRENGPRGMGFE